MMSKDTVFDNLEKVLKDGEKWQGSEWIIRTVWVKHFIYYRKLILAKTAVDEQFDLFWVKFTHEPMSSHSRRLFL